MRRLLVACCTLALAAVLSAPEAGAWSQEGPGGSVSGAKRLSQPDAGYVDPGQAKAGVTGSDSEEASPFSLGIGRSDTPYRRSGQPGYRRIEPPKALHPDSDHLYWGNTSTR